MVLRFGTLYFHLRPVLLPALCVGLGFLVWRGLTWFRRGLDAPDPRPAEAWAVVPLLAAAVVVKVVLWALTFQAVLAFGAMLARVG